MQFRHTKHSLLRRSLCGSEAPSQLFKQRSQSVQRTGSRSIRQSANRLKIPRSAPSGTDRPAEEARNPPVGHQEPNEDQPDHPGKPVFPRLGVNLLGRQVRSGQHAGGHRPHRQRDRVKQADLKRAEPLLVVTRRGRARPPPTASTTRITPLDSSSGPRYTSIT